MQLDEVVGAAQPELAEDEVAEELVEAIEPTAAGREPSGASPGRAGVATVRRRLPPRSSPSTAQHRCRRAARAPARRPARRWAVGRVPRPRRSRRASCPSPAPRGGRWRVVAALQRHARELQRRGPALGPSDEEVDVGVVELETRHAVEEVSRLSLRQSERLLADLGEQAPHSPASQRQVGIGS